MLEPCLLKQLLLLLRLLFLSGRPEKESIFGNIVLFGSGSVALLGCLGEIDSARGVILVVRIDNVCRGGVVGLVVSP